MFSTNIFLFLLLILPCRIIADDSSSFNLQDITYPIASSDADALQPVTDPDFSPETLLAGSENNVVAGCQSPTPSGRTRRSRLRKRQTDSCSWHPFKSGAPPTTDGTGAPLVPTVKIDPADVKKPGEDKTPETIPFGAAKRPEICGSLEGTIPVCHYIPGNRGSSRWLSPTLVLIPVRLCKSYFPPFLPSLIIGCFWWTDLWLPFAFFFCADGPGDVCMGLEETWCCSSTSPRPNEQFDTFYTAVSLKKNKNPWWSKFFGRRNDRERARERDSTILTSCFLLFRQPCYIQWQDSNVLL